MSTACGGQQSPAEPGSPEPGLDHLIRALTADAHPHELAGRDAALAAFRAASRQPHSRARLSHWLSGSRRLSTVAAALAAGIAGVTAAAYAQALPAPVQHIAYSVLSPIGVPDTQSPASPAPSGSAPGSAPGSATAGGHGSASPSPSASCPCPTSTSPLATAGSALVISVGRTQLPAGGFVAISGELTRHGKPGSDVRVRLLEQTAGSTGWQLVTSGTTGGRGKVRFGVVRLTRNAAFRLATPGGAGSAQVSVTVLPRVLLAVAPGMVTDRFVASARYGDPGDTVVLQELSGGTWQSVAARTLGALHRATFAVPPGTAGTEYRAVLQATGAHGAGVSGLVRQARAHAGIGAKVIVPATSSPGPTATVTSQATSPPPDPATPTPSQLAPAPDPVTPAPSPGGPPPSSV